MRCLENVLAIRHHMVIDTSSWAQIWAKIHTMKGPHSKARGKAASLPLFFRQDKPRRASEGSQKQPLHIWLFSEVSLICRAWQLISFVIALEICHVGDHHCHSHCIVPPRDIDVGLFHQASRDSLPFPPAPLDHSQSESTVCLGHSHL